MTAATITPSLFSAGLAARLSITVTGAAVGETMSVFRRVGVAALVPVMGAAAIDAEGRVLIDPEAPLNQPATWVTIFSGGLTVESAPFTVLADLATIGDPIRGIISVCAVTERDNVSRGQRVEVVMVERNPDPFVVWDVPAGRTMPVQLLTLTAGAEATVDQLLTTGDPVLLRCVCGFHQDVWVQPVDKETRRARLVQRGAATLRLWDLGQCLIYTTNPHATEAAKGNTLGDVDAAVTTKTLGAIAARWATLGAIAEADL